MPPRAPRRAAPRRRSSPSAGPAAALRRLKAGTRSALRSPTPPAAHWLPAEPPPAPPRPRPPPPAPACLPAGPPRARHWASLPGSRAPATLIGRWGFIHSPPTVRVHTHAPGARPPRGEWRGGGTGTAPPLVLAAWAPLSPVSGDSEPGGSHAPREQNSRRSPAWVARGGGGDGGLREALGFREAAQPRAPPSAVPPPEGRDSRGSRRPRAAGGAGPWLGCGAVAHLARLASHGFQRARSSPLRASPARLGFPSSAPGPASATPSTSAALREHPARAESYRPDFTPLMGSPPGYRGPDEKLHLQEVK
ncbi:sterile alpha motif domain-containing protein 1-like [Moschus berezovskii]|uniref:sterile alpha motif domain-containing protein 1-like n=1 Tax=Moschus berezovskii TaxID=68408 RepID=UPI0024446551|nr:sterile alpha motif domain-containing protein 1-like [Moschus berezovskii]